MFKIYLYHMSTENNRMDKTNYLTQIAELNGELREATSVINPSITFQITSDMQDLENGVLDCNYIYIPNFKRYYFVDNIVCVTSTLWEIDCSVDVLMSFKDQLGELDVFCNRSEFEYNDMLIDNKVPSNNNMIVEFHTDNTTPFQDLDRDSITPAYIVSVTGYKAKAPNGVVDMTGVLRVPYINYYIFPILQLDKFSELILKPWSIGITDAFFVEPSECLRSITVYPFNPTNYLGELTGTETTIKVSNKDIDLDMPSNRIENRRVLTISGGNVAVPHKYNNFLDYEPYTTVSVFIPFLGYADLPTDLVMGKNLHLDYYCDIETGEAIASIIPYTVVNGIEVYEEVVYSEKLQLGYQLPTVKTNVSQQMTSLFGAVLSIAGGALSGGAGLASGLSGALSNLATNYKSYAQSNKKPSDTAAFRNRRDFIKKDFISDITSDFTNFITNNTVDVIGSLKQKTISVGGGNLVSSLSKVKRTFSSRIVYPNVNYPNNYNHTVGKPSNFSGKLKNLHGYTELSGFHLEGMKNCTTSEQEAMNKVLRSGFLMPES